MFDNDLGAFGTGLTLNIDADSIAFALCCVFTDDDDASRQRIARGIQRKVSELMMDAGCDNAICFLTTSTNFRDFLVDDYKLSRSDVEKPANLSWAKRWIAQNLNSVYQDQLEADDLLGIYQKDDTVIWSIDKDLRQIPGKHLDDKTRKVIEVSEFGLLKDLGDEVYFNGLAGFYFQCLTGDNVDYIVGCGLRVRKIYGPKAKKAGQSYTKRSGVGPKAAVEILISAALGRGDPAENMLAAVIDSYKEVFGAEWQESLETQANLLFMVREKHDKVIRRWTYDGRPEYFDLEKGVVLYDYAPS